MTMKTWMQHWREDRGVSTLLLAVMLPAILGVQALTVDATRTFVERRELQNAVDAAALAAATYLPSTNAVQLDHARTAAVEYAALNGVTISPSDVTFTTDRQPYDRVNVQAQADVSFVFARTFGLSLGAVGSQGVAQLGQLGGMPGILPWGVEPPVGGFVFGDPYCLKLGSTGNGGACNGAVQGNFHALDIDDEGNSSASIYRDRIATGSLNMVHAGDIRDVVTGNMNGPTRQGLDDRVGSDITDFPDVIEVLPGGGYRVLDWSSPRIAVLPIVEYHNPTATILGFGVFFIETYSANGAVVGRFVDTVVPGGQWAPLAAGGTEYGGHVVRLIQ